MQRLLRQVVGISLRSAAARPEPVTIPMRAHIIWTGAISGHVSAAVHSIDIPSCAPAREYVAMPEGSSSAAPVITPGPIAKIRARSRSLRPFFNRSPGVGRIREHPGSDGLPQSKLTSMTLDSMPKNAGWASASPQDRFRTLIWEVQTICSPSTQAPTIRSVMRI